MIVRELLTRIGFQVGPDWKQIPRDIDNVKKKADEAAASFKGIFAGFVGFEALKSIIHVADEMQMLQARVGALPQTVGSSVDAFDEVGKHANAAGAKIETYATLYARIGSAARDVIPSQEKLLDVVDTISKAIATSGASATQQKSAFYQLSEAFNMDKLQGIHLKALQTDVPEFVHALGSAMGYTSEQFHAAAKSGLITAAVLVKAIEKVKSTFDIRYSKLPFTFSRAFNELGNRYAEFINKINNESGAVPRIAKMFADFFDGVFDGLNELTDALGGGGQALKIFSLAVAAAVAPGVVKIFVGGIRLLVSEAFLLFAALFSILLIGQDFYTWMNGGDSIIGRLVGSVHKANGELDKMKIALVDVAVAFIMLAVFAPISTFKALLIWIPEAILWLGKLTIAFMTASLAELGFTWPLWLIVAAIAAVLAIAYVLYKYLTGDFQGIKDTFTTVADAFGAMVDRMTKYWADFKKFYSVGLSDIGLGGAFPQAPLTDGMQKLMNPSSNSSSQATTNNVTINQTLPPGSTPEVATASYTSARMAFDDFFGVSHVARQMNQVSQ